MISSSRDYQWRTSTGRGVITHLVNYWFIIFMNHKIRKGFQKYSMTQTVLDTKNVPKWTSNVQLLCSTASTNWIIYSWLTSNPKISIWVHTRAKIHSFLKCQNSDHFWGCEKSIHQIQPDHNETCLSWWRAVFWAK